MIALFPSILHFSVEYNTNMYIDIFISFIDEYNYISPFDDHFENILWGQQRRQGWSTISGHSKADSQIHSKYPTCTSLVDLEIFAMAIMGGGGGWWSQDCT